MEKNMGNEMEPVEILGFKELKLSYYLGETILITVYTHSGKIV